MANITYRYDRPGHRDDGHFYSTPAPLPEPRTGEYVFYVLAPPPAFVNAAHERRVQAAQRARLLRESDWTQLGDSGLSAADALAWRTFRAAVRAVDPDVPGAVFPLPPANGATRR